MPTDVVIPEVGESITSGVIAVWLKKEGEYVELDEPVLELETDKITQELVAPAAGLFKPLFGEGEEVSVGTVVAHVDESAIRPKAEPPKKVAPEPATTTNGTPAGATAPSTSGTAQDVRATPLAVKVAQEHGIDLGAVTGSGPGGRVREHDVLEMVGSKPAPTEPTPAPTSPAQASNRATRVERMTPLRQRVASRLVEAQHNAAMLTTFNECDMARVMELRRRHKDAFEKQHATKLGFMSFFVKATVQALRKFPAINASIVEGRDGTPEIEYHDYEDISIAVSSPKGLVVPVLRNCRSLSFSEVERGIKDLGTRARDGKLTLDDLQGGTFTITNGGIFGSLMSTPILNPPQTGILGMHTIKNRVVEDPDQPGQVAIRPMMYLALSYDHRLVDGSEAVQFLVSIKEAIETPERLLFDLA